MSQNLYLLSVLLILGTILLVFGMKYFSAAVQAWARGRGEASTASARSETAAALAALQSDSRDMLARLASIEKILKEVE